MVIPGVEPVAEIEAGEDDGLEVPLLGDVFVGHVSNQEIDEDDVCRVDKSDVLKTKQLQIRNSRPHKHFGASAAYNKRRVDTTRSGF
jgi:hypothetical protein